MRLPDWMERAIRFCKICGRYCARYLLFFLEKFSQTPLTLPSAGMVYYPQKDERSNCHMYKIGELSRLCRLPVKTLRYYDDIGLLKPDVVDPFTGYRYYTAARLGDCLRILTLKELGFTLDEIRLHLETGDTAVLVEQKQAELTALMEQTAEKLRRLEKLKTMTTEGEHVMYPMMLLSSEPVRILCRRLLYETKEEAYGEMEAIYNELPAWVRGKRRILVNYETAFREKNFDLAPGVEIVGKVPEGIFGQVKVLDFSSELATLVCPTAEREVGYRELLRQVEEYPAQIVGAFYEIDHGDGTVELKVPVCPLTKESVYPPIDAVAPFVNDPAAVGQWTLLDIVPTKEHFLYGHEKCPHSGWLDTFYFLTDGEPYWGVAGWTKGLLYTYGDAAQRLLANEYEIEADDAGHTFLYLYMKHNMDGQGIAGGMPEVWVYEKVDELPRHASDIARRDFVDYPFQPDERLLGKWTVRDFYPWQFEKNFDPAGQNYPEDGLFLQSMEFHPDGSCVETTRNGSCTMPYTKGFLLNKKSQLASALEIRTIDDVEYLIREWKTGDYQYGGEGRIYHYVLTRA